jgi:hypothetical protein
VADSDEAIMPQRWFTIAIVVETAWLAVLAWMAWR